MTDRSTLVLTLAIFFAVFLSCRSELDDKQAASVKEPAAVSGTAAHTLQTDGLKSVAVDTAASTFEWVGAKVTKDHVGGFKKWTANGYLDNARNLKALRVDIDTQSLYTDSEKLIQHLKSEDFFDVAKYPTATFTADKISGAGGNLTVTGNLSLHGVTREISFPMTLKEEGGKLVARAEFTLKRFDFGIKYPGKPDDLIKEDVLIRMRLVAPAG